PDDLADNACGSGPGLRVPGVPRWLRAGRGDARAGLPRLLPFLFGGRRHRTPRRTPPAIRQSNSYRQYMKRAFASILASLAAVAAAQAEAQSFDFKDPKGVNNIVFMTDAPLESINGTATGISGQVDFDPEQPEKARGKIVVEAKSLRVPNSMMNEHLMGDTWLAAGEHPEIVFELESLSDVSKSGEKYEATANGKLTIRGKSQKLSAPVT